MTRQERHRRIAADLERRTDDDLSRALSAACIPERGHGTLSLDAGAHEAHVKLVSLTALELEPAHIQSTTNLFRLPTCYHYRLGSLGHGAWRELEAHRVANEWVLSDECPGLPLLHHWRVLPVVPQSRDDRFDLRTWGDAPAIARRVAAVDRATSSVALFLEHVPSTLGAWLRGELLRTPDPVADVLEIEQRLIELVSSVNRRGFLHMDAHFDNILTDGSQLFLGDFGLTVSRDFQLDDAERRFFAQHQNFDPCTVVNCLVHAVVSRHDERQDWRHALRDVADDRPTPVPPPLRPYLKRRAPLVVATGALYDRLKRDLTTPYPAAQLQQLLDAALA